MTPTLVRKQWYTTLLLLLSLPISANAHSGGRVYPIPELTGEMLEQIRLDDGSVDEWYDLIGEPAMTLLDFKGGGVLNPDPSDLDFRIWLAWHEDPARFYVAFIASDDQYKNTHDYSVDWWTSIRDHMGANDSIVLAIDGDHSGGGGAVNSTTLEEWETLLGQTQVYQAIARTAGGPNLDDSATRHQTEALAWTALPPWGESGGGAAGENPTISVIELYVTPFDRWEGFHMPGEILPSDLTARQVIGFGISVVEVDFEEDGGSLYWIPEAMSDGKDADRAIDKIRADVFLDGLLLSADAEPEGTAVESVSWGRIKAALEMK